MMDIVLIIKRLFSGWRGLVIPLLLLIIWDWMSRQDASHAYAFSSLSQITAGFVELIQSGELLINLKASLGRVITGLLIGATIGFLVGTLMAFVRVANILISPIYHAIRQVPLMGLVPLFALWYGNGDTSKLIVVSLSAFYPVVLATFDGMQQVERRYHEVGQILKLNQWKVFQKIVLPAALPQIFTGLSFALAFAWLSSIGSEILFSAGAGLGNLMMNAQEASRMDILIIVTIVIGLFGYGMTQLIKGLGIHLFRWRNIA